MVRGQTAYFLFCAEKREEAKALVEAAGQPGAKVSVTAVAKQLGVLWKALSDDAKQRCGGLSPLHEAPNPVLPESPPLAVICMPAALLGRCRTRHGVSRAYQIHVQLNTKVHQRAPG